MSIKSKGSWVESANHDGVDFPIENLPFGCFQPQGEPAAKAQIGVAIGNHILPLTHLAQLVNIPQELESVFQAFDTVNLNAMMSLPEAMQQSCRQFLTALLAIGSKHQDQLADILVHQDDVEMLMPCRVPDFTDFYAGIHHATNVGLMLRPDEPLAPNYKWVPVAYHGRSSSIIPSGKAIVRPTGQTRASGGKPPYFQASRKLDFELELGIFIGKPNAQGSTIPIDQAEQHFFGLCLLNDWSARDMQAWEAAPLGPFLAKNFATSISPWIVTRQALQPFFKHWSRKDTEPQPLPYLESVGNRESGALQVFLEAYLLTPLMQEQHIPAQKISQSEFSEAAYWTIAQLITHHASNGCNLNAGDLMGSGTLSGATPEQAGSLLELTQGGKRPILLAHGEERNFLEDGDTILLKAFCMSANAVRIGFGECRTRVLPAYVTS